jgi:hypothetical protein
MLASCAKSAPPPGAPAQTSQTAPTADRTPDGLKAAASKLHDKACACTDAACAKATSDELAAWKASVGTPMSSDPAVEAQLQTTVRDSDECIRNASSERVAP